MSTTLARLQASSLIDDPLSARAIGRDIRALRKNRGMTLVELAERVGRSVGYMSQVERGVSKLSIGDLRNLAHALGVPLGWFFAQGEANAAERGLVLRAGNRRRLGTSDEGLIEELLSPDLGGNFELILSEFAPGARSPGVVHRGVEEAGYIIEGRFEISIGERAFVLQSGDSFRFTDEDLTWRNPGPGTTRVVWVVAPPVY